MIEGFVFGFGFICRYSFGAIFFFFCTGSKLGSSLSALVIISTPAAAAISSQVLGLFSGGAGPTGASQVVTGGSGMLTGTSKVVTGDMESSGICFEEILLTRLSRLVPGGISLL